MGGGNNNRDRRPKRRNSCLCVCSPLRKGYKCAAGLWRLLCGLLSLRSVRTEEKDVTDVPSEKPLLKKVPHKGGRDNSYLQLCAPTPPSYYTVENVRYHPGEPPSVEHSNEDRYFVAPKASNRYQVVALFDGHDGPRAVDHVCKYVGNRLNTTRSKSVNALRKVFLETESKFFESIGVYVKEKQALEAVIPLVGDGAHRGW